MYIVYIQGVPRDIFFLIRADREKKPRRKCSITFLGPICILGLTGLTVRKVAHLRETSKPCKSQNTNRLGLTNAVIYKHKYV